MSFSGRRRLSSEAKLVRELLKRQPQSKDELCENANIHISTFYRVLPLLKEAEIIKETRYGFALWTYEEVEKEIEDFLDESMKVDVLPITLNVIASKIGVSPSKIREVIYPIIKKRGLVVRVEKGEEVVGRKQEGVVMF